MKKLILLIALGLLPGGFSQGQVVADDDSLVMNEDADSGPELFAYQDTGGSERTPSGREESSGEKHGGPCSKVNLDDAQKAKMKEAFFKFRESKIDLEANLKRAHLKYQRVVSDPESTFKSAENASKELAENLNKLVMAKQSFKNQVAFQILRPEQRGPARFCEMRHRHQHHHRFAAR